MYRVLHRSFCTFAEESTTAATTNIKSISQDLFKEQNLKTLVDKFKKASDIARFPAYLHSKQYDVVERLFKELPVQLSVKPDLVSYNTYIKALLEKGSFDSAVSVVDEME
ncbi:pentatricopeptide repeat-containing protein mitochondrial-like, partial [Trifolium medium]|nr:pentatricopeptide repeat-containing protein mitochondrial-like [Trifolium medium]